VFRGATLLDSTGLGAEASRAGEEAAIRHGSKDLSPSSRFDREPAPRLDAGRKPSGWVWSGHGSADTVPDMLPFTQDEFFAVFAAYNRAVWPAQVVLYALAAGLLGLLLFRPSAPRTRTVATG
jgi:hypothetical protein